MTPELLSGLSQLPPHYGAVISDIWGVLHNGRDPHPGAVEALARFRARGKVVLLSNAPRLRSGVEEQFQRIGVPLDCYDALVTSGEAARDYIAERALGAALPIFFLGPDRDKPMIEGLNVRLADESEAELVLGIGPFNDENETPDDYRELLARFRARTVPFLCANPDMIVQRGERIIYCAGALAKAYEDIGGAVIYFGKPHGLVFDRALKEAGVDAGHALMIGDSIETDIRGANRAGLDALFIQTGVHSAHFAGDTKDDAAARLLTHSGVSARFVMPKLVWEPATLCAL